MLLCVPILLSVAGCGGITLNVAPAIDTTCTSGLGKPPLTSADISAISSPLARWLDLYLTRYEEKCKP